MCIARFDIRITRYEVSFNIIKLFFYFRKNVQLGIPDKLFCLSDSIILQIVGELNTMPLLVMACRLCPKNIEGTMFSVMMSTINFGSLVSS